MELNCKTAEAALRQAEAQNPGRWAAHVRFAALACRNIAARCDGLSADTAYCYGLLLDIGRYAGVSSEKHLIDGYRFCMVRGWEKAAQICISHAFMLQDIRTSIGTFDVSDDDYRFMDVLSGTPFTTITTGSCSCATRWHSRPASAFWKSASSTSPSGTERRPPPSRAGRRFWKSKRFLRRR